MQKPWKSKERNVEPAVKTMHTLSEMFLVHVEQHLKEN